MSTGIAISPTLQGLTDYKSGTWELIGDVDQYIVLEFTDFDISCDSFFYVTHKGSSARVEYCNKRKPVYPIVSTVHQLEMGFTYETCSTTHKALQGFKALFHVKSRGHEERQLVTSEQIGKIACDVFFIFISFHFLIFFFWFCCFTSHVNSYGHCGTVSSLNHTFSWAGLNKRFTSNLCTYFCL